ncbi:MAG: hypothetical protein WAT17_01855 [Candidatus Saccharimonadales bacterium]|jgi:hypothetical protein
MNEQLEKQLIRQLRILNIWITIFGVLTLLTLGVIGFFLFQAFTFIQSTSDTLQSIKQTTAEKLDVKANVCGGTDSFSKLVRATGACQE